MANQTHGYTGSAVTYRTISFKKKKKKTPKLAEWHQYTRQMRENPQWGRRERRSCHKPHCQLSAPTSRGNSEPRASPRAAQALKRTSSTPASKIYTWKTILQDIELWKPVELVSTKPAMPSQSEKQVLKSSHVGFPPTRTYLKGTQIFCKRGLLA